MVDKVKNLGQIFTPEVIAQFMCNLIQKENIHNILEPSAGEGVFLKALVNANYDSNIISAYELDSTLKNKSDIKIQYEDFITTNFHEKFDLIIGNPPYVRWKNIINDEKDEFEKNEYWKDIIDGQSDLLYAFIYKCIDLLTEGGELIFITPSFWTQTKHSKKLREYLLKNGTLKLILNFNEMKLFKKVSSNIIIFKFIKGKPKSKIKIVNFKIKKNLQNNHLNIVNEVLYFLDENDYYNNEMIESFNINHFTNALPFKPIPAHIEKKLSQMEENCIKNSPKVTIKLGKKEETISLSKLFEKRDLEYIEYDKSSIKKVKFDNHFYYVFKNNEVNLFGEKNHPENRYTRLGDMTEIGNGMVSGLDKAFKINSETNNIFDKTIKVAKAADLKQYYNKKLTDYIFVNDIKEENELKKEYPEIYSSLLPFKEDLIKRYSYNKYIPWWHWVFLRNKKQMESYDEKIVVPCKERVDTRNYIRFSFIKGNVYATQDVTIMTKKEWVKEDLKYILALLNSDLIFTWIKYKSLNRGGVAEFSERPLSNIPIRFINWDNSKEIELHDKIVSLVNQILEKKSDPEYIKNEIEKNVEELYLT